MDSRIVLFYRQYLQQLDGLCFPPSDVLLEPLIQEQIFASMFDTARSFTLPPVHYRRKVLKTITDRIESAITDPDEDEISDELMTHMAFLCTVNGSSALEAAQQKSVVSYHLPSGSASTEPEAILILEARNLLASGGTTGLRTWDACLHLGSFLATEGRFLIQDRTVLELGAGTGLLSILCAGPLHAADVLSTDGDAEVVNSINYNARLNDHLPNSAVGRDCFRAKVLDWSDRASLSDIPKHNGRVTAVDLIIGADITYSTESFQPLVATLNALQDLNRNAEILIAATIRNEDTFAAFIEKCAERNFRVLEIPFQCPPVERQVGFFHKDSPPIRIVRITRQENM